MAIAVAAAPAPDDDAAVSALVAAAMTLSAALRDQLVRRLVDAIHVDRERNEVLLSPEIQRDIRLVRALRSVADELGHPPSTTEYTAAYEKARATGDPSLPTVSTFIKRHRTWKRALFAAGLIGSPPVGLIQQRSVLRTRPARYPTDRLIACLKACGTEIRRVPSVYDYDAWREQKRRESIASGRVRPDVPHRNTIYLRFGTWAAALATAGFDPSLDARNPIAWWSPVGPE